MKKLKGLVAAVVAAAATVVAPFTAQVAEAQTAGVCPAVAVVAARGSGENGNWIAQNYGGGPFWSNGREGPTLRAMFNYFESRYQADTGRSLMNSVQVLGLDEWKYPATAPKSFLAPPTDVESALNYARQVILPQAEMFRDSFINGTHGVNATINEYEAATGCHPQYVLAGYSQGAVVTEGVERQLAQQGKLAGVINIGSPYTSKNDPNRIGSGLTGDGVLAWTPMASNQISPAPRIEYCVADDPFCDLNPGKYINKVPVDGSAHASYFRGGSSLFQDRDLAARRFASWVDARR